MLKGNSIMEWLPLCMDWNRFDLSHVLILFKDHVNPKAQCHIQRTYSASATSSIFVYLFIPTNCSFHASRHYFRFIFLISKEPSIPLIPRTSLCFCTISWVSRLLGEWRYCSESSGHFTVWFMKTKPCCWFSHLKVILKCSKGHNTAQHHKCRQ